MKIFKIALIVLVAMTSLNSCGDDDDNNDEASIVGTWLLTENLIDGESIIEPGDCPFTLVFSANNVTSNELFGDDCDMLETFIDAYELNDDTLEVTSEGEVLMVDVDLLSNTRLELSFTDIEFSEFAQAFYTRQ